MLENEQFCAIQIERFHFNIHVPYFFSFGLIQLHPLHDMCMLYMSMDGLLSSGLTTVTALYRPTTYALIIQKANITRVSNVN